MGMSVGSSGAAAAEAAGVAAARRRQDGRASPSGRPGIGEKQLSASDLRAQRGQKVVEFHSSF